MKRKGRGKRRNKYLKLSCYLLRVCRWSYTDNIYVKGTEFQKGHSFLLQRYSRTMTKWLRRERHKDVKILALLTAKWRGCGRRKVKTQTLILSYNAPVLQWTRPLIILSLSSWYFRRIIVLLQLASRGCTET